MGLVNEVGLKLKESDFNRIRKKYGGLKLSSKWLTSIIEQILFTLQQV